MTYKERKDVLHSRNYADNMETETMGDRIRMLRQSRGLTQEALGQLVGVTKVSVSQWETGSVANIKLKTFLTLVDELGTTPQYLIFGAATNAAAGRRSNR
jgi:transcriptional regulator with XRE-family HTH domain